MGLKRLPAMPVAKGAPSAAPPKVSNRPAKLPKGPPVPKMAAAPKMPAMTMPKMARGM